MSYLHPGVYIEEKAGNPPVQEAATSTPIFMGVCERGPVNEPVLIASFGEFQRRCGGYDARSELGYAVKGFFDNGGALAYILRLAHYSDIADASTLVAVAASTGTDIESEAGQEDAGQLVSGDGPFFLRDGDELYVAVDGGAEASAGAVAFTAGSLVGSVDLDSSPYTPASSEYLYLVVDNAESAQVVSFPTSAHDAQAVADAINAGTSGIVATVGSGLVTIKSAKLGTSSDIEITSDSTSALLTGIGHTATSDAGSGDAADSSAVTATELVAALSLAGVTFSVSGSALAITSDTVGASSDVTIGATSGAQLLVELGFTSGQTDSGSASATEHAHTVSAANVGEWGNDLEVVIAHNPVFVSSGAGSDLNENITAADESMVLLSGAGLKAGVMLKVTDGTNTEYVVVDSVTKSVVGAVVLNTAALTSAFANTYSAASTTVESLEFDVGVYESGALKESWAQLSVHADADNYAETVINDEDTGSLYISWTDEDATVGEGANQPQEGTYALSSGTDESDSLASADIVGDEAGRLGLYALDDISDAALLAIPDFSDADLVQQVITYVEARQSLFYVVGAPAGYSRSAIKAYRENTLGADTKYAALYWPRIIVPDPVGTGSSPRKTIDPVGHVLGTYARVDNLPPPDGGVWSTAAGYGDFGKLKNVVKLEQYPNDGDQDVLNPIGVNCIRRFKGAGIVIFGGRTLSYNPDWKYIAVRRMFIYVEQSIANSTKADVFRNNDFRLWGKLKDRIRKFLSGLWKDGAMPGQSTDESFYVSIGTGDGTMTSADIEAGRLIGEIGIAPQRPAEFIIWRFSQYDGGSSVSE